jgi:hypothetical protein
MLIKCCESRTSYEPPARHGYYLLINDKLQRLCENKWEIGGALYIRQCI